MLDNLTVLLRLGEALQSGDDRLCPSLPAKLFGPLSHPEGEGGGRFEGGLPNLFVNSRGLTLLVGLLVIERVMTVAVWATRDTEHD